MMWDVEWDDLVTMELTHGKKDHPQALPSRLIMYLRDAREQIRIVKCSRDTQQAMDVYSSIEQARITYGQNFSKVIAHPHVYFHNVNLS